MIYTGIGSRSTPKDILAVMTSIAKYQAAKGYTLRSGGADGADAFFEHGAGELKEIYLPWERFNFNKSKLFPPTKAAIEMAKKFHPQWGALKSSGIMLMGRNSHQVMGLDLKTPTERVICWTKDAKGGGGTGQAIRIAKHYKIPVDDLADPKLLKEWTGLLAH